MPDMKHGSPSQASTTEQPATSGKLAFEAPYVLVPIWEGNEHRVCARFAKVDPDDYELISQWRWRGEKGQYAITTFPGRGPKGGTWNIVRMHNLILGLGIGGYMVDHISTDGFDNRRANLRIVTNAQNSQNRRARTTRASAGGIRGVSWNKRRRLWVAYLRVDRKHHHLGYFEDKDEAARAAEEARARLMPYSQEAMRREAA